MATACNEFEQDLVLYHYDELNGDARNRVTTHLRRCPGCASYLKELAALLPLTVIGDEPAEEFWQNYSREMRHKLVDLQKKKSWWQAVQTFVHPWTVPALAGTAVVALALTLTIGKKTTTTNEVINDAPSADQALIEVLPMAENLELFNNMDVLEDIDVLEILGISGNEAV
jgi:anti-sigma factor RsiW